MWTAVIVFFALATPLLLVWLVTVSIPELMHTRYRHELWRIRDRIVDDLISGELSLSPAARRLLSSLYAGVHNANSHTLRDGVIAYSSLRRLNPASVDDVVLGSDDIDVRERQRLADYLARYHEAGVRHIMFGSPSGWVGTLLLWVWSLARRPRQNVIEQVASAEIVESIVGKRDRAKGQFAFR